MKLRSIVLLSALIALPFGITGCEKSSNLGRMSEEANGIVKNWVPRFDELGRRGVELAQRGQALGRADAEAAATAKLLQDTVGRVSELRGKIAQAPSQIDVAVNNAHKLGTTDEVVKLMSNLSTDLDHAYIELNANLDAVASWLAFAEARPRVAQAAPPQPEVPAVTDPAGGGTPPPPAP